MFGDNCNNDNHNRKLVHHNNCKTAFDYEQLSQVWKRNFLGFRKGDPLSSDLFKFVMKKAGLQRNATMLT